MEVQENPNSAKAGIGLFLTQTKVIRPWMIISMMQSY